MFRHCLDVALPRTHFLSPLPSPCSLLSHLSFSLLLSSLISFSLLLSLPLLPYFSSSSCPLLFASLLFPLPPFSFLSSSLPPLYHSLSLSLSLSPFLLLHTQLGVLRQR